VIGMCKRCLMDQRTLSSPIARRLITLVLAARLWQYRDPVLSIIINSLGKHILAVDLMRQMLLLVGLLNILSGLLAIVRPDRREIMISYHLLILLCNQEAF
jgi:hypothetical protein